MAAVIFCLGWLVCWSFVLLASVSPIYPKHWLIDASDSGMSTYTSLSDSISEMVVGSFASFFLQASQILDPTEIEGALSHIHFATGLRLFLCMKGYFVQMGYSMSSSIVIEP